MMTIEELPECPVETTAKIIGSKWKLMILRDLLGGTKRYNELRKSIPEISQKVLTENLKAMEKDSLVIRKAYAEVPPRVEYSLSELGVGMQPLVIAMAEWGTVYQKIVKDASM